MESLSEVSEDITFNALKYKRYTSTGINVGGTWVSMNSIYWVNDVGELHREDGPAVIHNISEFWYRNGLRHRKDGPAIEYNSGTKIWWEDGKFIKRIFSDGSS